MRITPVAFDSMGARAAALYVEARGYKIFIDPGVSYAPRRYGLPPHPRELERLDELRRDVVSLAERADVIIITHYHYDHYMRDEEFYRDKILLIKHPKEHINVSQRIRAHRFLKHLEALGVKPVYADGREVMVGDVLISLSPPMPHGAEGSRLGYVLMVGIYDGNLRLLHTSDTQGPMSERALRFALGFKPNVVFDCGPPTYMEGFKVSSSMVDKGIESMTRLLQLNELKVLVVDHHTLRDLRYRERISTVLAEAERLGKKVLTAAEYAGRPVEQLEARRRELWETYG